MRAASRSEHMTATAPESAGADLLRAGGRAGLVTLGYSEMVISLRKLRYRIESAGLNQGLL